MRRLAVILTLLAVTFTGATAAAASSTGALGKVTVQGNAGEKPTLRFAAPFSVSKTVDQELATGTGNKLVKNQKITFDFIVVDSSWDRGTSIDFAIGTGKVIKGWDEAIVGQTVGSQLLLIVPPDKGYGTTGNTSAGITGTDTLVFVVDILDAY